MSSILDKTEFSEIDIERIISSKLEESINIEFKSAGALSHVPAMKKEISKDVSAFANSDGGLIFYGISEENHVASELSFIDGNIFTKEWLENVITSTIQQRIENLKIIPIRFNNDITKTVYVIKIPKSPNRPHINADKKFYRRYNFQSVAMEEYEVRDSYLKISERKVIIDDFVVKLDKEQIIKKTDYYKFNIEVHVGNDGNFLAEKYKLACTILNCHSGKIGTKPKFNITNRGTDGYKISSVDVPPIFPNESINVLDFDIEIPKIEFPNFIENTKIEFYLHSIGCIDSETKPIVINLMKEIVEMEEYNQDIK